MDKSTRNDKRLDEFARDCDDIISTAEAVKGRAFAAALGAALNAGQLVELISMLVNEESRERRMELAEIGFSLAAALAEITAVDMSEAEAEDLMKTVSALLYRRTQMMDQLNGGA